MAVFSSLIPTVQPEALTSARFVKLKRSGSRCFHCCAETLNDEEKSSSHSSMTHARSGTSLETHTDCELQYTFLETSECAILGETNELANDRQALPTHTRSISSIVAIHENSLVVFMRQEFYSRLAGRLG